MPRQRPAARDFAIIANIFTCHYNLSALPLTRESPLIIATAIALVDHRLMLEQILRILWHTMAFEVIGTGTDNAPMIANDG